jgi:putative DNA primase/helicase
MMNVAQMAKALGGDVVGRNSVLAPGPGHSRCDRSLSVRLDANAPDGFLTYSHAGDDWKICRDYVAERLGLPPWEPGDEQQRTVPKEHIAKWDLAAINADAAEGPREWWTEDELKRIGNARAIWNEARDPRGTLAEKYLRQERALTLPDELAGRVLRFHPATPWRIEESGQTDRVPALIVPFRSIDDDAITAVHRTALYADGTKRDRRMLGIVLRAAVKLDAIGAELAIAEGVETALAARQLGFAPAWALGSAGAISKFPVLEGVNKLTLLAENDQSNATAVRYCGKRWHRAGRKVRIVQPTVGSDLNDVLRKTAP